MKIRVALLAMALVLTGCAVRNDVTPSQGAATVESYQGVVVESIPGEKPIVTITNDASSASDLFLSDLISGSGESVQAGAEVTVHYVGVGLDSGEEFDSSWDRGEPISFSLNSVIPGWSEGVVGMQVGGRRLLVIPGELAYGPAGIPQAGIGPNETLVFVVDLLNISQ